MAMVTQRGRSSTVCRYEMPQALRAGKLQSSPAPIGSASTVPFSVRQPSPSPVAASPVPASPVPAPIWTTRVERQPTSRMERQPTPSPPPQSMYVTPPVPMVPPPITNTGFPSGFSSSRAPIIRQPSEAAFPSQLQVSSSRLGSLSACSQEGSHVAASPLSATGNNMPTTLSKSPSPLGRPGPQFGALTTRVPNGSPLSRRGHAAVPVPIGMAQQLGSYSLSTSSSSPALPLSTGGSSARTPLNGSPVAPVGTTAAGQKPQLSRTTGPSASTSALPTASAGASLTAALRTPVLGTSSSSRHVSPSRSPAPTTSSVKVPSAASKVLPAPRLVSAASKGGSQSMVAPSCPPFLYDSMLRIGPMSDADGGRRSLSPLVKGVRLDGSVSREASKSPANVRPVPEGTNSMTTPFLQSSSPPPPLRSSAQLRNHSSNRSGSLSAQASARNSSTRNVFKTSPPLLTISAQGVHREPSKVRSTSAADEGKSRLALSTADGGMMTVSGKISIGVTPTSLDASSVFVTAPDVFQSSHQASKGSPPPKVEISVHRGQSAQAQVSVDRSTPNLSGNRGRNQNAHVVLPAAPSLSRSRSGEDLSNRRSGLLTTPELRTRRAGTVTTPEVRHRRTGSRANCYAEAEGQSDGDCSSPPRSCILKRTDPTAVQGQPNGFATSITATDAALGDGSLYDVRAPQPVFKSGTVSQMVPTTYGAQIGEASPLGPKAVVNGYGLSTVASPAEPTIIATGGAAPAVARVLADSTLSAPCITAATAITKPAVTKFSPLGLSGPSGAPTAITTAVTTSLTGAVTTAVTTAVTSGDADCSSGRTMGSGRTNAGSDHAATQTAEIAMLASEVENGTASPERQCMYITEDIKSRQSVAKLKDGDQPIVPTDVFKKLGDEIALHMAKQTEKQKDREMRKTPSQRNARRLTIGIPGSQT